MMLKNVWQILAGFAPVFGYLISLLPLKKKPWLFIVEGVAAALFVGALVFPVFAVEAVIEPMLRNFVLAEYLLGFLIMLPVFSSRMDFGKALGLSLLLFDLSTEIHEIYPFVKMYLGFFDNCVALESYFVWFSPMCHLYSVVSAVLAVKIAGKGKSDFWFMLSWFLIGLLIEVLIYPCLTYGVYDGWEFFRRIYWIPILIIMFMKRRNVKAECFSDNSACSK